MNKIILILLLIPQVVFSAELDQSQNNSYSQRYSVIKKISMNSLSLLHNYIDDKGESIKQYILHSQGQDVLDFSEFPEYMSFSTLEFIGAFIREKALHFKEVNLSVVKMNPGVLPTLKEMIDDNGVNYINVVGSFSVDIHWMEDLGLEEHLIFLPEGKERPLLKFEDHVLGYKIDATHKKYYQEKKLKEQNKASDSLEDVTEEKPQQQTKMQEEKGLTQEEKTFQKQAFQQEEKTFPQSPKKNSFGSSTRSNSSDGDKK